jgi:hypothetical protein
MYYYSVTGGSSLMLLLLLVMGIVMQSREIILGNCISTLQLASQYDQQCFNCLLLLLLSDTLWGTPRVQVITRTSDLRGAATDAAVYIELLGDSGSSSGLQPLVPAGPQAFERDSADEFRLLLCQGLGELQQLRVVLTGSGAQHPAWHLLQVRVRCVILNPNWVRIGGFPLLLRLST